MAEDLRTLGVHNLHHALPLMNESSRGTSLDYRFDLFGFLALWRYWNFSSEHSLIQYVENEPAALILNCVDHDAGDAYAFYWGASPRFRGRGLATGLLDAACRKLRQDGYTTCYAVAIPDNPIERYRRIRFLPQHQLLDMQTASPALPAGESRFDVRAVDANSLSQFALPPGEPLHWCQRHAFLRNAGSLVRLFAAFSGDVPRAYAVVLSGAANLTLLDLRSPDSCVEAGLGLLRWLSVHDARPPFSVSYVFESGYLHRLLTTAGFAVERRFALLARDLNAGDNS